MRNPAAASRSMFAIGAPMADPPPKQPGSSARKSHTTSLLPANDAAMGAAHVAMTDRAAGPGDAALARELGEALEQAILALPDSLQAAFVLREIDGLSTRAAAAALEIGEPALKVQLHRARLALRAPLAVTESDIGTTREPQ